MGASPVRGVAGLCFESTDGDIAGSGPRMAFCFLVASSFCQAWFLAWFLDSIPENPTL